VVEHIEDDVDAVARMAAGLRPGGLFVATVPAFPILWGQTDVLSHHMRRYRRVPFEQVLRDGGLELERITHFNTWLFPAAATVRVGRRLISRPGREPGSDLSMTPRWADRALTALFASERRVVRRHSLPFGVSLLALARRPR
jgi:SAM-dependent methyltransferase